jgi:hypothetical protein
MKNVLLSCSLLTIFFCSNAFAHAYRNEYCESDTLKLIYEGNYPYGGSYVISLLETEGEYTLARPLYDYDDSKTPNTLESADVIFSKISTKVTEVGPTSSDCWFDHKEWKSEKIIEVNLINEVASKNLGLKQGDKIIFKCEEDSDIPNGKECL